MKKRLAFVLLYLTLSIFLAGCLAGGITPVISDEIQVRNKVVEIWGAISSKNWKLAKNCCYPGSTAYYDVLEFQYLLNSYPWASIWCTPVITSVKVFGNDAIVNVSGNFYINVGDKNYYENISGQEVLIKVGNKWYMYVL